MGSHQKSDGREKRGQSSLLQFPDDVFRLKDTLASKTAPLKSEVTGQRSEGLKTFKPPSAYSCSKLGAVIRRSRACRSGLRRRIFGPLPLAAECSRAMPDNPALRLRAFRNRDNSDA